MWFSVMKYFKDALAVTLSTGAVAGSLVLGNVYVIVFAVGFAVGLSTGVFVF